MGGAKKITRTLLNAAIFILMEVAALGMLRSHGAIQNFFLTKAAHSVMAGAWGVGEDVRGYFLLGRANDSLAKENLEFKRRLSLYEAMAGKPDEGEFISSPGFTHTTAKVIKVSRNKQHNYLILDKGSKDGVVPMSGVVGTKGVVGIVDAVGRNICFVVSAMNTDIGVSARIGKDGAAGPLRWDGTSKDGATLEEISLQYQFATGDTVYTSGYSSIFPDGIPLGVVTGSKIVNGATYDIHVELFQDFTALRWVSIVRNENWQEISELEAAEEKEDEE